MHFCKYPKNNEYYYVSESETDDPKGVDSTELKKKVKKLERTVDWIGNYVEEQTGIEPGKELTDSSEASDSSDSEYVSQERILKA